MLSTKYYVNDSGFNIFAKAGASYNYFKVTGTETTQEFNSNKVISSSSFKQTFKSVTPLITAGLGYEFNSGFGISIEGIYSFGKAYQMADKTNNIANVSVLLNISYLFK